MELGQSRSKSDTSAEHFDTGVLSLLIPDGSQDRGTAKGEFKQWHRQQDNVPPTVADLAATPFPEEGSSPLFALGAPIPTHTVEVPAASTSLPWYNPCTYSTLEGARKAGIWTYPSNLEERARCAVFRDLSQRGYFMGSGLRFGGDWLVYPGTPPKDLHSRRGFDLSLLIIQGIRSDIIPIL